jgi:hypothetical protein
MIGAFSLIGFGGLLLGLGLLGMSTFFSSKLEGWKPYFAGSIIIALLGTLVLLYVLVFFLSTWLLRIIVVTPILVGALLIAALM